MSDSAQVQVWVRVGDRGPDDTWVHIGRTETAAAKGVDFEYGEHGLGAMQFNSRMFAEHYFPILKALPSNEKPVPMTLSLRPTDAPTQPPCSGCGGPHQYDVSVPSWQWNALFSPDDFLCASCILRTAIQAGASLDAKVYGDGMNGDEIKIGVRRADAPDERDARIAELEAALRFYAENTRDCNKTTREGEAARDRLAKDYGQRAEALLARGEGE